MYCISGPIIRLFVPYLLLNYSKDILNAAHNNLITHCAFDSDKYQLDGLISNFTDKLDCIIIMRCIEMPFTLFFTVNISKESKPICRRHFGHTFWLNSTPKSLE